MIKILSCRRSSIGVIGMCLLFLLGYYKNMDVAASIAAICMGIAGANAGEAFAKKGTNGKDLGTNKVD